MLSVIKQPLSHCTHNVITILTFHQLLSLSFSTVLLCRNWRHIYVLIVQTTNCANCSLNFFPCLQCNNKYGLVRNGSDLVLFVQILNALNVILISSALSNLSVLWIIFLFNLLSLQWSKLIEFQLQFY